MNQAPSMQSSIVVTTVNRAKSLARKSVARLGLRLSRLTVLFCSLSAAVPDSQRRQLHQLGLCQVVKSLLHML